MYFGRIFFKLICIRNVLHRTTVKIPIHYLLNRNYWTEKLVWKQITTTIYQYVYVDVYSSDRHNKPSIWFYSFIQHWKELPSRPSPSMYQNQKCSRRSKEPKKSKLFRLPGYSGTSLELFVEVEQKSSNHFNFFYPSNWIIMFDFIQFTIQISKVKIRNFRSSIILMPKQILKQSNSFGFCFLFRSR